MASRRSPVFDPDVDPRLLALVEQVAAGYEPYEVELFSGRAARPTRPGSMHPRGGAIDLNLIDPKTGVPLPNIRDPKSAPAYQAFANAVYQAADPEMKKLLRWGGYFEQGVPRDWMHLDVGGAEKMAAGSWEGGFNPQVMQQLGLTSSGGLGQQAEALAAAGYSPEQIQRAFLDTIAGTESPGYDVLYGGGKFTDFSQHPNVNVPIESGPNKGKTSSAAGRYQFINPTWTSQAKKLGLKDFSPGSQDAAAWDLAQTVYREKTGGDLTEALKSGDPGRQNAAAQILSSTWTSLPGGIEQAKGYGTGTFADAYSKALGGGTATPSTTGRKPTPASPYALVAERKERTGKEKLTDAFKGIAKAGMGGMGGGGQWQMPELPAQPGAANVQAQPRQTADSQAVELQRQRLAQTLQRLNQGTLV